MYSDDDFDPEQELDDHFSSESVKPPEDLKLTIEVGLTEYSPSGLMELIARGLLNQIGGEHKWKALLESHLVKLGKERAESLVNAAVHAIYEGSMDEVDFSLIVRETSENYMNEKLDQYGEPAKGYRTNDKNLLTRKEYIAQQVVKASMDEAFKTAEKEWKEKVAQSIKETLADSLSLRLSKAIPLPPELKG